MSEFSLDIDGDEYHPVPESWISAGPAYDPDAPTDAVRLYATSAATTSTDRALRVRYVHPRRDGVLTTYVPAKETDSGLVPYKLATHEGWPRSWVPRADVEPTDIIRQPERDHFIDLWRDRLDDLEADGRVAIADGGAVKTPVKNREWIADLLERVPIVDWDRFTVDEIDGEQVVNIYGWIERDGDDYKDFVWTRFRPESELLEFTTSSDEYSEYLLVEWFGEDALDDHNECRRVEDAFDVHNAIEIHEQKTLTDGGQEPGQVADGGQSTDGIYQPYGDACTVHTCDKQATRYVRWDDSGVIAGFCERHAESKLVGPDTSEYSLNTATDRDGGEQA